MARSSTYRLSGRTAALASVVAVAIFAVGGFVWWRGTSNDPQKVFWAMLGNSLSTASITRHVSQTGQLPEVDQVTRLSLGSDAIAHGLTTVKQPSQNGINTVVTETLGTKDNDYARYVSIETQQKNKTGQALDFSQVLGRWGKSGPDAAQYLDGNILSVVPFAPLSPLARSRVLSTIKNLNVYDTDFSKAVSHNENGRPVFVYAVKVNPGAYVAMLKALTHELGLTQLDKVDPAAYANGPAEEMEIHIDKLSHQLTRITYRTSQRQEDYSGYGLIQTVNIPKETIPVSELQGRLQSIQ